MNKIDENILDASYSGTFYPSSATTLSEFIESKQQSEEPTFPHPPKVFIMPHAGYQFSGDVAGKVARQIKGHQVKRVVIISPSHCVPFQGVAKPRESVFKTPLGNFAIERMARKKVSRLNFVKFVPGVFEKEYGIEVVLPWIKKNLPATHISPFIVGDVSQADLLRLLRMVWGDSRTIIILSTDLSHFHDLETCQKLDHQTAHTIETLDYKQVDKNMACGHSALQAVLNIARSRGMRATRLALSNSEKSNHDANRVVGYGGWALHEISRTRFSDDHRNILNKIAARAIAERLGMDFEGDVIPKDLPSELHTHLACFVSLSLQDNPRGCIGNLNAQNPIAVDVEKNAVRAAFADRRYNLMTQGEFENLECEISILNQPLPRVYKTRKQFISDISDKSLGVILSSTSSRSTLLPTAWRVFSDAEEFAAELFRQASLPENYWGDDLTIHVYRTENFEKVRLIDYI